MLRKKISKEKKNETIILVALKLNNGSQPLR